MNTETKLYEHNMAQTKADIIQVFVKKVKDDIDRLPRKAGCIPIADVDIILSYRMKEMIDNG